MSITQVTARRIDHGIVGLLALAVGFLLVDRYYPGERREPVASAAPAESTPSAFHTYTSIALLPLVNMSKDEAQDYFSDGISEELLRPRRFSPGSDPTWTA